MLAHLKNQLAQKISKKTGLPELDILKALEIPKNYEHGHLSWPVFAYAKSTKQNPQQVAQDLQKDLSNSLPILESIGAIGGFLNFKLKSSALAQTLSDSARAAQLGRNAIGQGKTMVIDYGSPNVAKKMHIGHLRATIIGQAIRNLAEASGFHVIGVNHLGDWGTQFGKLAWALQAWGSEMGERAWSIDGLLELYIRFHDEAEKNPKLEEHGAETFLKLEKGDAEIQKIWRRIVDVSMADYNRLYKILNVKHDQVIGESFFNDKLEAVVQKLEAKKLLVESEGAQVVLFDEKENMAPCLIRKSDGASLYATRDLAAAYYRHDVMKGDELVYVVGADQSLHFKQVFRVLELLGEPWAKNCHHVSFGLYRFKEGKMSTRKGRVVHLEDVLQAAIEFVTSTVEEKNPDLPDKENTIRKIAVGAVFFNDLLNDRVKNVEFDLERAMSPEGDSGPYVQYTAVRCKSILRKVSFQWQGLPANSDWTDSETRLMFSLLQFQDVVKSSYLHLRPNILAQYLLNVCSDFSHFYHQNRVLGEEASLQNRRLHLVELSRRVLEEGLGLLNVEAPDQM
ncbi:MAG: arginine--tRNA ligase [Bdellovibrionales bacterium]